MSLALIAVALPPASTIRAAGIVVTTTADAIDANGGACAGLTIGSLPGPDNLTSLREAICAANNTAGADDITFSVDGVFLLTRVGDNEDVGSTGDLDISQSLTITGNGQANTFIDGNTADRLVDAFPSAPITVAISNVTLRNGRAVNSASNFAGAIYSHDNVTMNISSSAITSNAADGSGGAIENRGTLTVTNSTFANNEANGEGGAIRNTGTLTIASTTFTNNAADFGGALWNGTPNGTPATLTEVTFTGNHAEDRPGGTPEFGDGGAIYSRTSGSLSVLRSTLTGNTAARNGGGVYFADHPDTGVGALTLLGVTQLPCGQVDSRHERTKV